MEIKKAKKADLEGQKSTSLLIGYIITLATIFVAFEWTTREYKETEPVIYAASVPYEEEIIPITQPIFQTAAPPPPVEGPQVAEIIDIVENDEEIEEEEVAVEWAAAQAVYDASLATSAKVVQKSLLDFL